jgi:hypothetical protein
MDTVRFRFSRAFSWYPTCLLRSDQWSLPTDNWPLVSDRDHRFSRGPFSLCTNFHFIITSGYWVILAQTGCVTFDSPCTGWRISLRTTLEPFYSTSTQDIWTPLYTQLVKVIECTQTKNYSNRIPRSAVPYDDRSSQKWSRHGFNFSKILSFLS